MSHSLSATDQPASATATAHPAALLLLLHRLSGTLCVLRAAWRTKVAAVLHARLAQLIVCSAPYWATTRRPLKDLFLPFRCALAWLGLRGDGGSRGPGGISAAARWHARSAQDLPCGEGSLRGLLRHGIRKLGTGASSCRTVHTSCWLHRLVRVSGCACGSGGRCYYHVSLTTRPLLSIRRRRYSSGTELTCSSRASVTGGRLQVGAMNEAFSGRGQRCRIEWSAYEDW